jgi:diguanylate cyclase (GGDEF)-like protein
VADVFNLQLPGSLEYREMLSQAHAQLANVAFDAAGELLRKRSDATVNPIYERLTAESQALTDAVTQWDRQPATLLSGERVPLSAERAHSGAAASDSSPTYASTHAQAGAATATLVEDDAALLARLRVAVSACRQIRSPLSLLLIEVDRLDTIAFKAGERAATAVLLRLESICRRIEHPGLMCQRVHDSRFGVVLPKCDRRQAVEIGNQLRLRLRASDIASRELGGEPLSISIGISAVNLPPRNFAAEDMIESADRCVRGVASSGGDGLKSIELC